MSLENFRQILPRLMSEDNDARNKAEEEYKALAPQLKLEYLILVLRECADPPEILHLDSVLLRRLFRTSVHTLLKEAGISFKPYKDELINLLKQPTELNFKKKIADAATEFNKKLVQEMSDEEEFQWPEFMKYLFDCIVSPNPADKEIALNIISYSPTVLSKHLYEEEQCFNILKQFFIHCLSDQKQNIDFRIEGVRSVSSFIQAYCEDEALTKQLNEIVIHLMNLIVQTLPLEEDYCDTILKAIQDLAEKCTYFLKPHFDNLFRLFVETMLKNDVEDNRRRLCLEIVVTLTETIPSTVRKRGKQYLPQIVNHLLLMMTDLDDDIEEWTNSDEIENEDYDSNVVVSETSLDRLSTAIGGKLFLPLVLQNVSNMCKNENWKYRHAGLMCISTISEGCHDQMLPLLTDIVNGILPFLDEIPNPNDLTDLSFYRVTHAACNCLGQMSTDFQPTFQEKFHQVIIPKLVHLFSTSKNPRVQAHAAAAMVNFLEGCTSFIIKQHIDLIADKIEEVLNAKMNELVEHGKKLVLEQTIVTLSSLADSAQEHFIKYYDRFFPLLKFIIQNAISPELRLLRGKAIECISLIALSVGKEKFCTDASDIMNLLLKTQTGEETLEADDPQLVYIIASWSRICKILGPDFQPYLPFVMPQILKIASFKIEVTILEKEEVADVEENEEIHCLDSGEETFSVKTTGLEEKATACQMIICYARELKYAFVDYVEETVQIMIPLLNFYFHERIRTAAAECLPYLIESGKAKGEEFVKNLWLFIFPELLKSIEYEPEKDILCDMLASLSSCLESVGKNNINDGQVNQITIILQKYVEDHFKNVEERKQRRGDEDYDEMIEKELVEEDDEDCYILGKISEVIHSLFAVFKEEYLTYFEILLPLFVKLAGSDRSYTEVQWAICIMDDVIEFTGHHSLKYKEFFLPLFINGMRSEHPEIRQAASYGFGVMGKNGGAVFAQDCAAAIPLLVQMVQEPDSRSELNNLATENAISSVTKIMHFNNSHLNLNEIIPVWFSWLPAYEDESELPYIYNFLFMLIENKHQAILGENNSNLPRILFILAEVLCRNAVEVNSEIGQKICMFLNSLKSDMDLLCRALGELNSHPQHIQQIRQTLNI